MRQTALQMNKEKTLSRIIPRKGFVVSQNNNRID